MVFDIVETGNRIHVEQVADGQEDRFGRGIAGKPFPGRIEGSEMPVGRECEDEIAGVLDDTPVGGFKIRFRLDLSANDLCLAFHPNPQRNKPRQK